MFGFELSIVCGVGILTGIHTLFLTSNKAKKRTTFKYYFLCRIFLQSPAVRLKPQSTGTQLVELTKPDTTTAYS